MRVALSLLGVVLVALLATEVTMQPSTGDRLQLIGLFAGAGIVTGLIGVGSSRWVRRLRSLRHAVVLAAVAAVGAAVITVVISATSMFLSTHDLKLVLVAMGLGGALGVVVATAVSRPLEEDLAAIRLAADRAGEGDLEARTGVARPDEVGALARAVDDAIAQLAAADRERQAMDAARREFFAAISHDLRTPLTSLRTALEAIQDGFASDPDAFLSAMRTDLSHMTGLVEDLFLLARIESGGIELELDRLDVAEIADEAVEVMRALAEARQVELAVDAGGPAWITGAAVELSRVLRNLLSNAIRHAPAGSTVTVTVQDNGAGVRLTVTDDGPGFPDDFRDRAFESFTRSDEARTRDAGGAGLGLAIARGLVDLHDGQIRAHPGPGGRVEVDLPA